MNFTKIVSFIKTTLSLIKIFLKIKKSNNKIIFFYFPVKAYYQNIIDISEHLKKNKKIDLFLIYNNSSQEILKNNKNSYFLDINYLKFIPFSKFLLKKVNLFISSYVNYVFLPESKNIYICHDIADSPMVNANQEKKLFLSLAKLHYIFLSSSNVVEYFRNKFLQFGHNVNDIPELINTGYLKLDKVMKELRRIKNTKNHILLAPTFSRQMKSYNMSSKLDVIINNILKKGEKVIFRPHPLDLTLKGNFKKIKKIVEKYENNSNFFYDNSHSYMDSYSRAKMLITDFSGTAYTFAYSTLRPVIFFSKNENKFAKTKIADLFYYRDRAFVGLVSQNINQLLNSIAKINKRKEYNKNKIFNLRKKRIKYVKVSLDQTIMQILKICKKI
tara:strand:- start:2678 stop:3835 length:1158 start_codon:yes stop_codon:yes gene_type:complete